MRFQEEFKARTSFHTHIPIQRFNYFGLRYAELDFCAFQDEVHDRN